jgi:hemoglobin
MADPESPAPTPTLYEWAGGQAALERLFRRFYDKVLDDDLLEPLFAHMDQDHPQHVAAWIGEVFGGPKTYTEQLGGYERMLAHHHDKAITEAQRRRWVSLLNDAADEVGLPADPEFRSAFVAYIEWGTRIAVANSQPGSTPPAHAPVPRWGWGEAPPWPG